MAADILSLSKARKAKIRGAEEKQAVQNRILFGRSKGEKQASAAAKLKHAAVVDGAKLVKSEINAQETSVQETSVQETSVVATLTEQD